MIAPKDSIEPQTTDPAASDPTAITDRGYNLPNSRKVYLAGELHADLRVPFREISLAPTKTMSGEMEVNEPVRVYDTSGPWGDADQQIEVTEGLPALRGNWIRARGDVEEITGRAVTPIDDGARPHVPPAPLQHQQQPLPIHQPPTTDPAPPTATPIAATTSQLSQGLPRRRAANLRVPFPEIISPHKTMRRNGSERTGPRLRYERPVGRR